jgi:uncharacterized protein
MAPELLSQADNWFCFHLLSEGDASTLGRYNAHYSDDVLAHLIGEPIPGNCFMWSAPNQPFVLPVRVRSFEELYRSQVKTDPAAMRLEGTRAQQVLEAVSEALERLKGGLLKALKEPRARFVRVPDALPGSREGIGLYSGQLYYMIKEIKTVADTQSEDQLMEELLTLLLGEGSLFQQDYDGKKYFCASIEDWQRALGSRPRVRDV